MAFGWSWLWFMVRHKEKWNMFVDCENAFWSRIGVSASFTEWCVQFEKSRNFKIVIGSISAAGTLFLTMLLLTGCSSEETGVPTPIVENPPLKPNVDSKSFTELEPYRDTTTKVFSTDFKSSKTITGSYIPNWKAFSNEITNQAPPDLQAWACLVRAEYQANYAFQQALGDFEERAIETADQAYEELKQALKIDSSCVDTREYVAVRVVLANLAQHASLINTGLWKKINEYPIGTPKTSIVSKQTIASLSHNSKKCMDLLARTDLHISTKMKEYSKETFRISIPEKFEEAGTEPDSVLSNSDINLNGYDSIIILCGRDVNFEVTNQMKSTSQHELLNEVADKRMKRIGDSVVCSGETTVCNVPARFFQTRKITIDGRLLSCQIYIFIKNEALYIMSFRCDADLFDEKREMFSQVRASFQFREK
ncbi:hypothetical protein [Gimesia fumaroli]|nr:hypothetical protein [Gimesia fumaroli]